jgi:hypothetical protein
MIISLFFISVFIIVFSMVISSVGELLLKSFGLKLESRLENLAMGYFLGLGIFINGLIIIGLLGIFKIYPIIIYAVFWVIAAILIGEKRWFLVYDVKVKWIIITGLLFFNYTVCFTPPHMWDEVAYHLPEINEIVKTGKLSFPLRGDIFYGSLPLAMEVLYLFGVVIGGTSLMHVLHFTFFIFLIIFLYGYVERRYSQICAWWVIFLLFFLEEFGSNVVSGYVDGAAAITEVVGFLIAVEWVESKNNKYLYLSSLMWGFSLAIKYSAIYTIPVYLAIIFLFYFFLYKPKVSLLIRPFLICLLLAVFMGGFWYIKNLVMLGNPIFPYFFGHHGISDGTFELIKMSIKGSSEVRTILGYLLVPYKFVSNSVYHIRGLIVASLIVSVFIPIGDRKKYIFRRVMLLVVIINVGVWYFIISDQTRFLFSTIILATISGGVMIGSFINMKKYYVLVFYFLILMLVWVVRLPVKNIYSILANISVVKLSENEYIFGLLSKDDYLARYLGKSYYVIAYINRNLKNESIINYWNHNGNYYLVGDNKFVRDVPEKESDYIEYMRSTGIRYLTVDVDLKKSFINNIKWKEWASPRLKFEEYFIRNANIVYGYGENILYEFRK